MDYDITADDAVATPNTLDTDPSDTKKYNVKQLFKMAAVPGNPGSIYSLNFHNGNSIELQTFPNYIFWKFDETFDEIQDSTKQSNINPEYYLNKLENDCSINAKNDPSFEAISSVAVSSKILQSKLPSVYHRSRYKLI